MWNKRNRVRKDHTTERFYIGGLELVRLHSQSCQAPFKHHLNTLKGLVLHLARGVSSDGLTSPESLQASCFDCALRSPNEDAQQEQARWQTTDHPASSFYLKNNTEKYEWCCPIKVWMSRAVPIAQPCSTRSSPKDSNVFWGDTSGFLESSPCRSVLCQADLRPEGKNGNCFFYFSSPPYISLTASAAATFYFFPLQLFQ